MPKYEIVTVACPDGWQATRIDDVPPELGSAEIDNKREPIGRAENLEAAIRQVAEFNEKSPTERNNRWAVLVEPGIPGRRWNDARLCTPITYRVMSIWWPEGWAPRHPSDVPNCAWRARDTQTDAGSERTLTYAQATATVRGLNQQVIDQAGEQWYVVTAAENEAVSQTILRTPMGTETTTEVRRLYVLRPQSPDGRGDCSHCPAHCSECAVEDWGSQEQMVSTTRTTECPRH